MAKSLSNIIRSGSANTPLTVSFGGTGLISSGNTGNVLTSTGSGWASSAPFSYTLPTANTTTLGGIKVDGTTIIANNGVISGASTYTLPTANTTTLGGVKVDGTTIIANNGVISANVSSGASATKTIVNTAVAYTVTATDLGKIINCTSGTFNVSLTAAATLGSGFTCTIWNTSNAYDAITIDPNASETIDGVATLILRRGEGLAIVCDGINWQTDDKKPMRAYAENIFEGYSRPVASGSSAIAIGSNGATSSGDKGLSINGSASSNYSSAIGLTSGYAGSVTATGAGAMALGGSYASGVDSFAAGIGNNTSSYGATGANGIAIGKQAKATGSQSFATGTCVASGAYSFAAGWAQNATGSQSVCMGGNSSSASGDNSVAFGRLNTSSGTQSFTAGNSNLASALGSIAWGIGAKAAIIGKYAFASQSFAGDGIPGDAQYGKIVLRAATTTTAVFLTSDGGAASTTNQLIVASGQAMAIQGTLIAKETGSNNMAGWTITGIVSNNGGTMAVSGLALTFIGSPTIYFQYTSNYPTIAVDNTNKGIVITSGKAASGASVRWVATLDTSEVTLA